MSSTISFVQLALLGIAAALLLTAAVTDIRARMVPNRVSIALALLAPVAWLAWGATPADAGMLVLGGLMFFSLGYALWELGYWGAGDAKLLAALALWTPPSLGPGLLMLLALANGVIAVAMLALSWRLPRGDRPAMPYAVGIALGGLIVLAQLYLNHSGPNVLH